MIHSNPDLINPNEEFANTHRAEGTDSVTSNNEWNCGTSDPPDPGEEVLGALPMVGQGVPGASRNPGQRIHWLAAIPLI